MMSNGFVIAIDGPVASGKGTIAQKLAKKFGGFDLYTGATYRCLALYCLENHIAFSDSVAIEKAVTNVTIDLTMDQIILNGKDVTTRIQENDAASGASQVASYPFVRAAMVKRQQEIANRFLEEGKIVIAEGRDIGTIVFPRAAVKYYVTASDEIRAKRRFSQYEKQGDTRTFEQVFEEIKKRDQRDTTRDADPLASNPKELGYVLLDNTDMNEEESLRFIEQDLERRKLLK